MPLELSREDWLESAASLLLDDLISPIHQIRSKFRYKVTVGYAPSTKPGSSRLGACLSSNASTGGYNEIFISPEIEDSRLVIGVLLHELIHAVDDCKSHHGGLFRTIAKAVGFIAPLTSISLDHMTPALLNLINEYVRLLGDIPHSKLAFTLKKGNGRSRRTYCECGFKCQTSVTQFNNAVETNGFFQCPVCFGECQQA